VRSKNCEDTGQLTVRSNGFSGYEVECCIVKTNFSIYYLYKTANSFEVRCIGDDDRFTWKGMFGKRYDNGGLDLITDQDDAIGYCNEQRGGPGSSLSGPPKCIGREKLTEEEKKHGLKPLFPK
jgi:hypothetical protein